jgi:hypothetical protein
MTKQSPKSTKSSRIEKCRVVEIGVDHMGECLEQGPQPCSHALPFGYCFLCTHPRVDEIIENTRKSQLTASAA